MTAHFFTTRSFSEKVFHLHFYDMFLLFTTLGSDPISRMSNLPKIPSPSSPSRVPQNPGIFPGRGYLHSRGKSGLGCRVHNPKMSHSLLGFSISQPKCPEADRYTQEARGFFLSGVLHPATRPASLYVTIKDVL